MLPLERRNLKDALMLTFIFLLICWVAFFFDQESGGELKRWGLKPRDAKGLVGIFSVHFLHKDLAHIANNTWAFLVLNTYLFFFYRSVAFKVLPRLLLFSGILLWLWGRPANHIGASVAIYGIATFLFFSGTLRRSLPLMAVSAMVLFSYGSMFWGMFPIQPEMSWEGHLSGALTGIALAYYYRTEGPQRKRYQYEIDEERELEEQARLEREAALFPAPDQEMEEKANTNEGPVQIIYHYKATPSDTSDKEDIK
jgi:membrane associated rhomboid family serine protease